MNLKSQNKSPTSNMASHNNILEKPVGICPEHISTEPTTLRMKQNISKLSSTTGYTITDATGNSILYTSDKKSSGWDSCRSIYDSIGVRLFDLDYSRQFWSIKLPDRESDPVATIFRRCYNDADYIGIRFVDSASGRDVKLSVRAKFTVKKDDKCVTSKDVCIYVDDTLVMQTKMVNRYTSRVPFKTNEWEVFVAQGMDLSFASAIAMYFAIILCEKPVVTKTEAVLSVLLPGGIAGGGMVLAGAPGGGGGGDGGGGGGGGSC